MSKGSKRRPTDEQKFNENWDKIFGQPKESPPEVEQPDEDEDDIPVAPI